MEFIHNESSPATIAELDLFKVPPTQTVIESMYDVEYSPVGSIDNAKVFEFIIPASEHYTDLSASYLHAKLSLELKAPITAADKIIPANNFAAALFEQLDVYFGTVNVTPGNSLFHYQTYIDDLFFKHKGAIGACQLLDESEDKRIERIKTEFDIILPIHGPLFQQEKLLIDRVPIALRLKTAPDSFGLKCDKDGTISIVFKQLSLFIRRVKLFMPVQMTIESTLASSMAKYYFQRHEVKSYHLHNGFAASSIDNVYNGQLPRKVIIGFVTDKAFNGDIKSDAFKFEHKNLTEIALVVNGIKIPSSSYKPDFKNNIYMREYFNMYRSMNQDSGLSIINIKHDDYVKQHPLFVFDLTDDGTLATDSGALSLIKRGTARIDVQFTEALTEGMHMIVFGIYDSVIQIDSTRNVITDY